jgi:hypothetical protein
LDPRPGRRSSGGQQVHGPGAGTAQDRPGAACDETPARAAGGTRYVHLACTRYLTCLHTGDRPAEAIDVGGVLSGYQGIIVRDGYAGYGHLTSTLHAWCGAHLLRDLKACTISSPSSNGSPDGRPAERGTRHRRSRPRRRATRPGHRCPGRLGHSLRASAASGLAANLYPCTGRTAQRPRMRALRVGFPARYPCCLRGCARAAPRAPSGRPAARAAAPPVRA